MQPRQGSIGFQELPHDSPGVLGFDDGLPLPSASFLLSLLMTELFLRPVGIDEYCGKLRWSRGRRLQDQLVVKKSLRRRGTLAFGTNTSARLSRRQLDSAWTCTQSSRNILMLFAPNVHNSGAGYNSCRNLEWQMCAAQGKLPGQRTPTIIFANAPNSLNAEGRRPLGRCGGYSPQGCGRWAYSNDDIFFLEVCMYSKICSNNAELFALKPEERFRCHVSRDGFRELQALLIGPHPS